MHIYRKTQLFNFVKLLLNSLKQHFVCGFSVYSNNYNNFLPIYLITNYHYNFCIVQDGKVLDVHLLRLNLSYQYEVHRFIDASKLHGCKEKKIYCPWSAKYCCILSFYDNKQIISHLVCPCFMKGYLTWEKHGEGNDGAFERRV